MPFLLVHGLASNARLWDGVAAELASLGHPAVAIDLRGHGRSDKPDDGYDVATVADDVALVLDELGWADPVVVGQSWGGNVVVELTHRHPGRVGLLAAVDGGTIDLRRRFPAWEECAHALTPPPLSGTDREDFERRLRRLHPDWPEAGIQGTMASFEVREDDTIAPWLTLERHLLVLRGLWEHDPSTRFPSLDLPVLLVPVGSGPSEVAAGRTDRTDRSGNGDKEDAVRAALAALPNGRVHWFHGADHDVHAQHPAEVAAVLHDASVRWGR